MMPQLTTTDSGICSPNTETISTFSSSFKAAVNAFILLLYLLSLLSIFPKKRCNARKKSRRPRRPRPTSSFAHALPGDFYVTYHSTIVPNFVAPGLTFYVLLCSISQRPKKCCAFCANFRSCLMPIAQFPSRFSPFRFVFRVKNGAKSAHYSLFVYPVYQIYIGGPAAMQTPQTRL